MDIHIDNAVATAAGIIGMALGLWNAIQHAAEKRPRLRVTFERFRLPDGGPTCQGDIRVANTGQTNVSVRSVGLVDKEGLRVPCVRFGGFPVVVSEEIPELLEPGAAGHVRVAVGAKDVEAVSKWRFAYAVIADGKEFRTRRHDRLALAEFATAAKAAHEAAEADRAMALQLARSKQLGG